MLLENAKKTITYLEAYYKNGNKVNAIEEMILTDYFVSLKDEYFKKALKELVKNEVFFPKVATISKYYNAEIKAIKYQEKKIDEVKYKCVWCESRGYILQRDKDGYEYIYHCTQCKMGENYKYDGRLKERNQTEYYTRGINEIYDVENYNKKILSKKGAMKISKIQELIKETLTDKKIN